MKVCYNTQADNTSKHPLMPSGYPFIVYEVEDDFECPSGFSESSIADFETYKATFDLTDFIAATTEAAAMIQQKAQRQFGEQLAQILIDELGEEIILLENTSTPIDVSIIMTAIQPIKELLSFGLLKSARTALAALLPAMSAYEDYINSGIDQITDFLTANGWD